MFFKIPVQAATYKGFEKSGATETLTMKESIERFIETDNNFLILLQNNPAFYKYPKNDNEKEFRHFLEQRIRQKKKLKWIIKARGTEIYELSDSLPSK